MMSPSPKPKLLWRAVFVLFVLSAVGCRTVWVSSTETLHIDAAELERIKCRTHNGRIEMNGDPQAREVLVTVRKRAGGYDLDSAEAALRSLRVVRDVVGGELRLGYRWDGRRDHDWQAAVSFEVAFPDRLAVVARTHNGAVMVNNVRGSCHVRSHNGAIRVEGEVRTASLRTHNGRLRAKLSRSGEVDYELQTHNGSIDLTIDHAVSARLRASTHNGSVLCDLPLARLTAGRRSVGGVLGGGEGNVTVRTHNGGIRIHRSGRTF